MGIMGMARTMVYGYDSDSWLGLRYIFASLDSDSPSPLVQVFLRCLPKPYNYIHFYNHLV